MSTIAFKKIMVGFAFSPNLKANIYEALRMADYFRGELVFVHVGIKTPEKDSLFNQIVASSPIQSQKISVHWRVGDPIKTLIQASKDFCVDLILLGALKRENVLKFYLGSIARKITRKAKCSVLLLIKPSVERQPCQHIVVNGFDSPQTKLTIEAAFMVANALGAKKISLVCNQTLLGSPKLSKWFAAHAIILICELVRRCVVRLILLWWLRVWLKCARRKIFLHQLGSIAH